MKYDIRPGISITQRIVAQLTASRRPAAREKSTESERFRY